MTATNHALTGAIIGLTVHNPLIALPAALLSHVVCDAIPHYGGRKADIVSKGFVRYLLTDAALCGVLVLVLFFSGSHSWLLAAVCAFVAASPDFLWIRMFRAARQNRPFHRTALEKFLGDIQWFQRPIGAFVEVAWFVGAIALLSAIL